MRKLYKGGTPNPEGRPMSEYGGPDLPTTGKPSKGFIPKQPGGREWVVLLVLAALVAAWLWKPAIIAVGMMIITALVFVAFVVFVIVGAVKCL